MSAPAGSGKTVLLRSWIAEAGRADRTAWVRAGQQDHAPQRFWLSVLGALRDAGGLGAGPRAMWSKWVYIAVISAVTCLMRSPVGGVAAVARGPEFALAVLAEAAAVAAAAGFAPAGSELASLRADLSDPSSPVTSSLYRDLQAGAATEVEPILGDLEHRARDLGVAVPHLGLATLHLRVYERRRRPGS